MNPRPRILIVGTGGIGGTLAGTLLRHHTGDLQPDVTALTRNREVIASIASHGFRLRGVDGSATVAGTATDVAAGPYDVIFLATQPPQMEDAARAAAPMLAADGVMVPLQNGLPEERVARIVGPDRVIGGIVGWGGSMPEPGVFERTSGGGFTLGRLDGRTDDPRLGELATLLEVIGPVTITDNLRGARWSKLAFNCAISTLGTIGGDRFGPLVSYRFVRRVALQIFSEVVEVANAEGVELQKLGGTLDLYWIALTEAERAATMGSPTLFAKHSLLLAVGARYRRLRSSMLAAIERGRPPAVDFLNGEIIERARRHGIDVPVNQAAHTLVHDIAQGQRASSVETLRTLAPLAYGAAAEA